MLKLKRNKVTNLEDTSVLFKKTYTEKDVSVSVTINKDKVSGTAHFNLDASPISIRYSADLDGAEMLTECQSVVEYSLDVWVFYEHEEQMRMSAKKNGVTYKMTQEEREFYQRELIGIIYDSIYEMIEKAESEENKKLGNENGLPCYNPDFNLDCKEDDFVVFDNIAILD